MPSAFPSHERGWPGLDGLRGVAIAGVVMAHLFPLDTYATRSGAGVLVFFALSGFLITGLLLKELARHGDLSYRRFYGRRAFRLLPALTVMLVALNVLSLLIPDRIGDPPVEQNAKASLAAFFYVGNLYDLTGAANVPQLGWIIPTWSLSVEEQFYLVWPVVLLLALRRSTGLALGLTLVMIVASPVLRFALYDAGAGSLRVARGPDTNADFLMWGSALALLQHRAGGPPAWLRRAGDLTGLVGAAALGVVVVWYQVDVDAEAPVMLCFVAPATVLLIASVVNAGRVVPLVLSAAPLVYLGRISYSLYLFHFPIFIGVQAEMPDASESRVVTVKLGLSLAAAIACHHLVEKPLNNLGRARLSRPRPELDPVPGPVPRPRAAQAPRAMPAPVPPSAPLSAPLSAPPPDRPAPQRPRAARRRPPARD